MAGTVTAIDSAMTDPHDAGQTPPEPQDRGVELSADERAAARAFVARCEVRLSTFHRIAVGMLSGAGLLVVLPVVARDSVTGVIRALLTGGVDVVDGLVVVSVIAMLAVPATALWMLFADLTRFYFHANHLGTGDDSLFTPRFTLTSLRLSSDELGTAATADLESFRSEPRIVELLVPTNDASRARIDRQLQVYGGLGDGNDDMGRAMGLFDLAASKSRPLLEEVAKVEYGMARHVLRLRGLVLRYVKALLALLTTAVAVYSADAVVVDLPSGESVSPTGGIWLAGIILIWSPVVVLAVTSPIRWIEHLMRDDGAPSTGVADDPELTIIERVTLRIAAAAWLTAGAALVIAVTDGSLPSADRWAGFSVLVVSVLAVAVAAITGRFRNLITIRV